MKQIRSYICSAVAILLGVCLIFSAAALQTSTLRGDVNADGVVDARDVVYLLRHMLMPEKYPIAYTGDMNVDEQMDMDDVVYLLRHTLKPEEYPLECLEHQPQVVPAKASTCTQTGLTQGQQCKICGKILHQQEVVPVRAHQFADELTCHARPCTYSDCEYVAPATGAHKFTQWFTVDAGGCVSVNYQVRACMDCSYTENTEADGEPVVHGHSYVFAQQTNPTCTEPGLYILRCKNCDLEHRQEFPATGHTMSGYISEVQKHYKKCLNSNCTYRENEGEHSYDNACDKGCNVCDYSRVTYHSWENTYTSNAYTHWIACGVCGEKKNEADHSGGTATCQTLAKCETCQQSYGGYADHSHTKQTVDDAYLKSAADCTNAAVYYYSCACGDKGTQTFTHGTALGHDWEDSCTTTGEKHWIECGVCDAIKDEADHSGGTATCQTLAKCETCQQSYGELADHSHTQQTVNETYLKTSANCTDPAVYYYSCACGDKGTQTFTHGTALGHDWEDSYTTTGAKHWIECGVCDAIKDEADHSGGTATCQTLAKCETCQQPYGGYGDHSHTLQVVSDTYLKTSANCTEPAVYYYSCACGDKGTQTFTHGTALGHDWNEEYSNDSQKHWIECDVCKAKKDEANHTGGTATCQTLAKCETCQQSYGGYADHSHTKQTVDDAYLKSAADCTNAAVYYYSCACGDKGTQTFTHGTALGHDWEDSYTTTGAKHWIECGACDAIKDEADHSGGTATCQTLAKCETCQQPYGGYGDHSHTLQVVSDTYLKTSANCTDPAVYYYSCACGDKGTQTFTHGTALGHDWEDSYTTTGAKHWIECGVCDAIKNEADHSGGTATCQTLAKCETCQQSYGGYADHSHTKQTVTNTYLKSAADCTNAAVYYYSCACGDKGTQTFTHGTALGHDWEDSYTSTSEKHWIKCSACDAIKDEGGHTFGEYSQTKAPTCYEAGQKQRECSACGYAQTESIATVPHVLNNTGVVTEGPVESGVAGEVIYRHVISKLCVNYARCGYYETAGEVVEHAHEAVTFLPGIAPACTQTGLTAGAVCGVSGCQEVLVAQTQILALGHDFKDGFCTRCGEPEVVISEGLAYELSADGTYYILAGIGTYEGTNLVIPDTYKTLPVKQIKQRAFYNNTTITTVVIPESITSIGNYAFYNATALEKITFNAVNMVDMSSWNYVFYQAGKNSGGIDVTIGKNVQQIPAYLFYPSSTDYVPNVQTVAFESQSQCIRIGGSAFRDSKANVDISSLSKLKAIESQAFYGAGLSGSLTLPNGLESIGSYALGNTKITQVHIPDSVTSIGDRAFGECSQLAGIWVDEDNTVYCSDERGVLYTKDKTFLLVLPGKITGTYAVADSVTKIAYGSFMNCADLTELSLPKGANNMNHSPTGGYIYSADGRSPFYGCTSLEAIWVDEENPNYRSDAYGVIYNADMSRLLMVPPGKSDTFTVPDSVTYINASAFSGCTRLEKIVIPDSVTYIGDRAFSECSALTEVRLPSALTYIGDSTFSACESLKNITIPSTVTAMGGSVFYACTSLESITIPSGITSIGSGVFQNCTALEDVTIPETVTRIGSNAFMDCAALKTVVIPGSVTDIGSSAFRYCAELTSVTIPEGVQTVGNYGFNGCAKLKTVHIPVSVTDLGDYTFDDCGALTTVYYAGTTAQWNAIDQWYLWNPYGSCSLICLGDS